MARTLLSSPPFIATSLPSLCRHTLTTNRRFISTRIKLSLHDSIPPIHHHLDSSIDFTSVISRAEGFLYTLADAAVAVDSAASTTSTDPSAAQKSGGWFGFISDGMEFVLKVLKDGLSAVHVPFAYGFAIILLTVLVKVATLPLTKKQVESTLAMQNLQPKIKAIQQRYAGNQYMASGADPEELLILGCFPTLATIPVWIGLYQALSNVANEGLLTEGFFWIPSLGGPTTIAARQSGSGISWLFPFVLLDRHFVEVISPLAAERVRHEAALGTCSAIDSSVFCPKTLNHVAPSADCRAYHFSNALAMDFIRNDLVDGHPPLGWTDTAAYLVLPVLLVLSQYVSMEIMKPPQTDDPTQKNTLLVFKFLPLMIGYFSLSVWLRKLGGAKPIVNENASGIITAGRAKRSAAQPGQPGGRSVFFFALLFLNSAWPKGSNMEIDRFRQLKEEEKSRKLSKALHSEDVQAQDSASDKDLDEESKDEGEEVLEEAYASSASQEVPDISRPKRSKRSKRKRAHPNRIISGHGKQVLS
ncbi:hypothetical protein SADUNF_Sadunf09G0021000 [Salix dunnii]|uniref:Membrane insertase YidC/Oxa/ALB C-terminal domain-containing protein n=1 Tax=Salix dunnii TaxID=1413687 RepID=A0A835JUI1_9ROSI|nr:hypothetical protein SADUNF_Sadunf09G0021000 [Salix dunnii]